MDMAEWVVMEADRLRAARFKAIQDAIHYTMVAPGEDVTSLNDQPERTETMDNLNYDTAILLVNPAVRVVAVSYDKDAEGKGVKPYVNFKTMDATLDVGDMVIIPTNTRHERTVVRVEEVDIELDLDFKGAIGWIVSRFDDTPYQEVVAMEKKGVAQIKVAQKKRKQEELRKTLLDANPELAALKDLTAPALQAPPVIDGDADDIIPTADKQP